MADYIHGYTRTETKRLRDQAATLMEVLHHDTHFEPGSRILEIGCGVGAQTLWLARQHPDVHITAIDINEESLQQAQSLIQASQLTNVHFQKSDLYKFQPPAKGYDHIFISFVLEHLPDPLTALRHLKSYLKEGGGLISIEGDHGSFFCHPNTAAIQKVIQCFVDLQASQGGNALIGRELYPLLTEAGFQTPRVSCRTIYVDGSKPDLIDGFSKQTFIAMVAGIQEQALKNKLLDSEAWQAGIRDLYRATESDGTFCYSFFKAQATLPRP